MAALFLGLSFYCGLCLCYHLLVIRIYFFPHSLPNPLSAAHLSICVLCIYGWFQESCHIPIAYNHGLHSPVAKLPICQESWGLLQDREPRHSDLFLPDTLNPWAFLWCVCVFRDLHYPKEGAVFWVPDTYFLVPPNMTWARTKKDKTPKKPPFFYRVRLFCSFSTWSESAICMYVGILEGVIFLLEEEPITISPMCG